MRNKAGHLAVVVPYEEADDDIKAHGGKVVLCVKHAACGLGAPAWHTEPVLYEQHGLPLAWDDRDLKPLGAPSPQRQTGLRRSKTA